MVNIIKKEKLKSNLDYALMYYNLGFSVIPLQKNSKQPILAWKEYQTERATKEQVIEWFYGTSYNVGIITGAISGLTVIDVDNPQADPELTSKLFEQNTWTVKTSRGFHFYFLYDKTIKSLRLQEYEIKSDGSYIIAPPSIHPDGSIYQFIKIGEIKPFPQWLKLKLNPADPKQEMLTALKEKIMPHYTRGTRQDITIWTAALLLKLGFDEEAVISFLYPIWDATKDEEKKMRLAGIKKTVEKFVRGERIKGATGLMSIGIELNDLSEIIERVSNTSLSNIIQGEQEERITISTVKQKILSHYKLFYDEFYNKIFIVEDANVNKFKEVNKEIEVKIHATVEDEFKKSVSNEKFYDALFLAATQNTRNLLHEYLKSLTWDGKERIKNFFCDVFGVQKNDYTCTVAQNFFVGAVARAMNPGCEMKSVLILIGPQNTYKSRVVRELCPQFSAELNVSLEAEKDFFLAIQGAWIVEIPELSAIRKSSINRIKAVVSTVVDRFRPPYDRTARNFPRTCVFVITTNEEDVLVDSTGNVRFLPIKIKRKGDVEWVKRWRDQLWAEAMVLYQSGYTYWEEPPGADDVRKEFYVNEEWEKIVIPFVENKEEVTIFEIAVKALNLEPRMIDKATQQRIAEILRNAGYTRKVTWKDGKAQKVWVKDDLEDPF